MIKVWQFSFNQVPGRSVPDYADPVVVQEGFDFNMDLMAGLEARGFEGVFYSEHHFLNSLSPCPNLLVAALAMKTETLKIGVMGNVLAFHQPWRLAEELHMLDYLTKGRLEIGVSSGVPPEFLFVNIPQPDIRPMYTEVLDFIDRAAEEKMVSFSGKFYNYEDLPIMPRPRNEARRRKWMTIYSDTSCREAARRGYKVCTGYQSVEAARKAFDAYYDEAELNGISVGPDDLGVRRQVVLAATDAEAKLLNDDLQGAAQERMADTFKLVNDRLERAGVGPAESVKKSGVIDAASVQREEKPAAVKKADPGLMIAPEEFVFGSPQSVAEQIIDQCSRLGAGNIMAYHNSAMDAEQVATNYDLWEQVIPILKKAEFPGLMAA